MHRKDMKYRILHAYRRLWDFLFRGRFHCGQDQKMTKKGVVYIFFAVWIVRAFWWPATAAALEPGRDIPPAGSSVNVESFKMVPQSGGAVGIELQGYFGDVLFTVKGSSGSLVNAFDPELKWPIDLTLEAAGITVRIDGFARDPARFRGLDLNFVVKGQSSSGLEKILGTAVPIGAPFDFKGNLKDEAPGVYRFEDLLLKWEKSSIRGSCKVDASGDRPYVEAGFFSHRLDLRGLSKPEQNSDPMEARNETTEKSKKEVGGNGKVFSAEPFDLEFLNALNLNFELIAEKVLLPRAAFANFHLKATLDDGVLTVDPFKGDMGEGQLDGRIQLVSAEENVRISARLDIHQMNLKRLVEQMELRMEAEGGVDFNMNIDTRGRSLAETMAALNGSASLVMGKGKIDPEYLNYLGFFRISLISAIADIIDIPGKFEKKTAASEVGCFAMRFDFKDGLADLSALVLDTPKLLVVGNGNINLAKEQIDIYIKPLPKEGFGAKGLAEINLSLAELTRPFSLGGTLSKPRVSVDTTRTFVTLGKALGGAVLFGPAGVAVALISGKVGSNPENPCLDAIEAAEKGVEIKEKNGAFNAIKNFLKELSPIR